jgi:hypothetical protein
MSRNPRALVAGEAARAMAGGQHAPANGYFYKGGQFLPTTTAEPGRWRIGKKWVNSGSELVEPGVMAAQPTPFSRSLFSLIRDYTLLSGSGQMELRVGVRFGNGQPVSLEACMRPGVRGVLGQEELSMQEMIDAYNGGQRWFDVKPDMPVVTTCNEPAPKQTDTQAFREWFGDSKVVDANGAALVVYHGTDAADDFSVFDVDGSGAWFAQDEYTANGYTDKSGDGASRLIPVYLKIECPLIVPEDIDLSDDAELEEVINRINDENGTTFEVDDFEHGMDTDCLPGVSAFVFVTSEKFLQTLRTVGFDGILAYEGGYLTWCALRSEQIKSAIGNLGTYDPDNPDICMSRVPSYRERAR